MKLNKHLPMLVMCALLAALSMILKKFAIFNIDWLRFSLENTPILLSGILFGPVAGALTGIVGDLLGCLISGFGVNPVVTLGAALVGGTAGLAYQLLVKLPALPRIILSIYSAHILGSMLVKTIGLRLWYGTHWVQLAFRIPTYLIIGAVEIGLIWLLMKNKAFVGQIDRIIGRKNTREAKQ